jgi:hypothetical protein
VAVKVHHTAGHDDQATHFAMEVSVGVSFVWFSLYGSKGNFLVCFILSAISEQAHENWRRTSTSCKLAGCASFSRQPWEI